MIYKNLIDIPAEGAVFSKQREHGGHYPLH